MNLYKGSGGGGGSIKDCHFYFFYTKSNAIYGFELGMLLMILCIVYIYIHIYTHIQINAWEISTAAIGDINNCIMLMTARAVCATSVIT